MDTVNLASKACVLRCRAPGCSTTAGALTWSPPTLALVNAESEPNAPKSTDIGAYLLDTGHSCPIRSGNAGVIPHYLWPAFRIVMGSPEADSNR